MKIVLHIGVPKTGSTAIQAHLSLNRGWLEQQGYAVPHTGWSDGYGHVHLFEDSGNEYLERLQAELQQLTERGITAAVLSWEGLNIYSLERLNNLKQHLAEHEISVLAYLREQSEVVQSGYLQATKQRRQKRTMEDFEATVQMQTPGHINYEQLLNRYEQVFGLDNMDVRVYERDLLKKKNVVLDFLNALGLEECNAFILAPTEQNISLDAGSAYVLNALDAVFRQSEDREALVDLLLCHINNGGRDHKHFLSRDSVKAISEYYRHSNDAVLARYVRDDIGRKSLFSQEKATHAEDTDFSALGAAKLELLHSLKDYRCWMGEPLESEQLQTIGSPAAGWSFPESQGLWTRGKVTYLRFRISPTRTSPHAQLVKLYLKGHYFADNTSTQVCLEEMEDQRLDLTTQAIELPLSRFDPYGRIEIIFKHDHPTSPKSLGMGEDKRELSYMVHKAHYELV